MDKIRMEILGLSTSPSSGGAYALILHEVDGSRRLPIIIGAYEAQAIALELEHIKPPRPMTHDLLKQMVEAFDATVSHIWINDLREGTFFSAIIMDGSMGETTVDARPSDAIALAIRFEAPIFVASTVLNDAGISQDPDASKDKTEEGSEKNADAGSPANQEKPDVENIQTRLELLQNNLKAAIQAEDYELAARLRDEIQRLKG